MTFPSNIDCKIAQDLLVGYVAGEVSAETRAWVTQHLDRCPECRQALAQYIDASGAVQQVPLMTPPADPGRRTLGRMRRTVWLIAGVVVLCLAITASSVVYVISNFRRWTNMPADQPVPAATYTVEQAMSRVDLSALGLTRTDIQATRDTAQATFQNSKGNLIQVKFTRTDYAGAARSAFNEWFSSYPVKISSAETNVGANWTAKFRSGGQYYYGWQHENWFITISVPERAPAPADLRDQIRDLLFTEIRDMQ